MDKSEILPESGELKENIMGGLPNDGYHGMPGKFKAVRFDDLKPDNKEKDEEDY